MSLYWRLAFRNLFRNRRRSVATGCAIAAGFLGLSLLGSYIYAMQMGMQANMVYLNLQGHLQIYRQGGLARFSISPRKYLIDDELDRALDRLLVPHKQEVEFEGKFLTGAGVVVAGERSQPFLATGYEPQALKRAVAHPFVSDWGGIIVRKSGAELAWDRSTRPDVVSVTPRMREILGLGPATGTPADRTEGQLAAKTLFGDLNAVNVEIGLTHTTGIDLAEDTSLRMPITLLQELLAAPGYQWRSLFLRSGSDTRRLRAALAREIERSGLPLEIFSFDQEGIGDFYLGTINFLYVIAGFFILLICTMVALSIVNSLTLGILERTKELGTLKALGFSKGQIVGLFVRETICLAVLSVAFGFAGSLIASAIVNAADFRFQPPNIEGEIRFRLVANPSLYLAFTAALLSISAVTAFLVSNRKLRASAVSLLGEAGV